MEWDTFNMGISDEFLKHRLPNAQLEQEEQFGSELSRKYAKV
eukprot:CAMPEP_0205808446 /NCGR_PEP_ID=MMETSP0205-20121125/12391_1 /ASSEMBLY_ACC=CAM_ASM_000278 /TAXON_ID=36767 /ORGANISM="Euplotes focardii, Strain TN1" /LENGTH=41 /DNA_ID= /DNA_START= /DNA_END= /DNA_ORIENTATION=